MFVVLMCLSGDSSTSRNKSSNQAGSFSLITTAYADDYWGAISACDGNYSQAFGGCMAEGHDAYFCYYRGTDSYVTCVNNVVFGPPLKDMHPDFCDNARLQVQTCNLFYGAASEGWPETEDAFYTCYEASGIGQCE
jgi:hypothetical protein